MLIAHPVRARRKGSRSRELLAGVPQRAQPGHSRNKVIFHLAAIKHIIAGLMANSEESQMIS
ncbi:MAG: hypothetical protein WBX14_02670, partial [Candidatus Udaeobacter sp.]